MMKRTTPDPTGNNGPTAEQLIEELYSRLDHFEPQPHWSLASKSLSMRLRGIYAMGPNADQMGPDDKPEFGWRTFNKMPPIQFEAATRIEELEAELRQYRIEKFTKECDRRGI